MRTKTKDVTKRKRALEKWYRENVDRISRPVDAIGDNLFEVQRGEEYLVLTDDEANEKAEEYILDSLWAFNAVFIIEHSNLPCEAEEMIKTLQEKQCEGANDTIKALIIDLDEFVHDAIITDGRGHFMASYNGEEHKQDGFYIYRVN